MRRIDQLREALRLPSPARAPAAKPKQVITVTKKKVKPIIQIRRKPTQTRAGGRPVLRVQRRPVTPTPATTRVPKPPEIIRATPTPRKFSVPSFEFLTGGKGLITPDTPKPKAIAKVEPPRAPPEKSVSIHKSILKGLGSAVQSRVNQKFGSAAVMPAIGAVGRVLTGRAATAAGIGAAAGSFFGRGGGGGVCPAGEHLNKQDGVGGPAGTYCVKNRRMNFGNARAARRGVRRLKGARKLLRDIEKMMPSKPRARRAPAGHSAHLHHTGGS